MKHVLGSAYALKPKGISGVLNPESDLSRMIVIVYDDETDKVTRREYEVNK